MIESFTVGDTSYNVVRASALQQDEVLSMLTNPLVDRFVTSGQLGIKVDEEVIFSFFLAMPFSVKRKIDELILSRVTKKGTDEKIDEKHFDGRVMEMNRLRAKVLMWNLESFFTYWAKEYETIIEALRPKESQPQ